MELTEAMGLCRNALWMAMMSSAPILLLGLVVGLMIALFQAVTQLQEQTLTFVPKIGAMMVAAAIFIPWIADNLLEYSMRMFGSLPW